MNLLNCTRLSVLALVLTVGTFGCKKAPKGVTPIPRGQTGITGPGPSRPIEEERTQPLPTDQNVIPKDTGPIAQAPREGFENMDEDRQVFSANTVYFDFDRSTVKPSEGSKIEPVAAYLKGHAENKLRIEGHCDERGTEEYNRSLGERRALALREYLVNLGLAADRIQTISFGEDRPADPGHNEAAWEKNRRGEFILLKPR